MYLEFILLISDYIKTLDRRTLIYEWLLPIILSATIYFILQSGESVKSTEAFKSSSISLLGILAGFSITIITILTTSHSRNLDEIKKKKTKVKIGKEEISLYQLLLINFTYSVVVEAGLIIFCLLYPIILENFKISSTTKYIGFSILAGLIVHVLLLTIRNLTSFYFILTKKGA